MAANDVIEVPGEGKPTREVAQRLFAAEYNASNLEFKEGGERSPSYVITPLGAKVNRLFLVGVLTSNENIGAAGDMWRAQVTDPTGKFNIYAGQYQPEAAAILSELRPPAVVAVVGKSRTYSPEPGVTYTSIRPETITLVDVEERDRWILETARHTKLRLEALREAQELEPASVDKLVELGYPKEVSEGVVKALEHYGKADIGRYAAVLKDALEYLLPGGQSRSAEESFQTASTAFQATKPAAQAPAAGPGAGSAAAPPPPAPEAAPAPEANSAVEDAIFDLTGKLDDGKGAPWEEIVAQASKQGVSEEQVEEALNSLMDKGLIYEPVLGRLKRT